MTCTAKPPPTWKVWGVDSDGCGKRDMWLSVGSEGGGVKAALCGCHQALFRAGPQRPMTRAGSPHRYAAVLRSPNRTAISLTEPIEVGGNAEFACQKAETPRRSRSMDG